MRYRTLLPAAGCALALLAAPAAGQTPDVAPERPLATATEGERISLSGSVRAVDDDEFTLDTGRDAIEVDLDDFADVDVGRLRPGDRVTVTGRVDDGLFSDRELDATSIHLVRLGATLAATGGRPDRPLTGTEGRMAADDEWVSITGRIENRSGDSLVLRSGGLRILVDADDADGADAVNVGDRVRVSGRMEDGDLFERREIDAAKVTPLES